MPSRRYSNEYLLQKRIDTEINRQISGIIDKKLYSYDFSKHFKNAVKRSSASSFSELQKTFIQQTGLLNFKDVQSTSSSYQFFSSIARELTSSMLKFF